MDHYFIFGICKIRSMIDINLYRFRIGTNNCRRHTFSSKTGKPGKRMSTKGIESFYIPLLRLDYETMYVYPEINSRVHEGVTIGGILGFSFYIYYILLLSISIPFILLNVGYKDIDVLSSRLSN